MAPVRLLPLEHIEEKLKSVGCRPLGPQETPATLKTAEWWVTPWGHHFTLPREVPDSPDGTYGFGAIWAEIEKTKPPDGG